MHSSLTTPEHRAFGLLEWQVLVALGLSGKSRCLQDLTSHSHYHSPVLPASPSFFFFFLYASGLLRAVYIPMQCNLYFFYPHLSSTLLRSVGFLSSEEWGFWSNDISSCTCPSSAFSWNLALLVYMGRVFLYEILMSDARREKRKGLRNETHPSNSSKCIDHPDSTF